MGPLRRGERGYSRCETNWQLKTLRSEKEGYSRWAPPSVKGGQFKPKERELQLECYSTENNSLWTLSSHRFNSVPIKPIKIHANMATLDMPTTFPGLQFHPKSNECLHCSRDKHAPKLYSSTNNINHGPINLPRYSCDLHTCIQETNQ